jgi:hypothetical protein
MSPREDTDGEANDSTEAEVIPWIDDLPAGHGSLGTDDGQHDRMATIT